MRKQIRSNALLLKRLTEMLHARRSLLQTKTGREENSTTLLYHGIEKNNLLRVVPDGVSLLDTMARKPA